MKPPRVLFFMLRLKSEAGQITGGTRSTLHIIEDLEGYSPYVVTNSRDSLARELERLGVKCEVLEGVYPWEGFMGKGLMNKLAIIAGLIFYQLKLYRLIRRIRPEVIHCDDIGAYMVFIAAKLSGTKLLIYYRNNPSNDKLRLIHQVPMLFAESVVAISNELAGILRAQALRSIKPRITHIYNGIDAEGIERFKRSKSVDESRSELGIPDGRLHVGVVAFISPRKRQLELINSISRISSGQGIDFFFIGGPKDEAYFNRCKDAIKENGLTDVCFLKGYQEEMYKWYRAMDIVCLPSDREGVPRAVLEAQAFELPVVCFDIPGTREAAVDGSSGFLVSTFEEFVSKIESLAADAGLRRRMGACGKDHVFRLFDSRKNAAALSCLYGSMIAEGK